MICCENVIDIAHLFKSNVILINSFTTFLQIILVANSY